MAVGVAGVFVLGEVVERVALVGDLFAAVRAGDRAEIAATIAPAELCGAALVVTGGQTAAQAPEQAELAPLSASNR